MKLKPLCYGCAHFPCTTTDAEMIARCPIYSPKPKPPTNYDKLISKSPEEMAEFIVQQRFCGLNKIADSLSVDLTEYHIRCKNNALEWLKEATDG